MVDWGSIDRQSYGSPRQVVSGNCVELWTGTGTILCLPNEHLNIRNPKRRASIPIPSHLRSSNLSRAPTYPLHRPRSPRFDPKTSRLLGEVLDEAVVRHHAVQALRIHPPIGGLRGGRAHETRARARETGGARMATVTEGFHGELQTGKSCGRTRFQMIHTQRRVETSVLDVDVDREHYRLYTQKTWTAR